MKKNKMMRIASVLLVAVLLSTCAISGTFAKYTSTISGSDTARVALWKFTFGGDNGTLFDSDSEKDGEIAFNLFNYTDTNVDVNGLGDNAKVIAPGTAGSFVFQIKNESEVNAKYTIKLEELNSNPAGIPLQYSVDGTNWKDSIAELVMTDLTDVAINMGVLDTKTIYWRWVFDGNVANTPVHKDQTDVTDTALGLGGTAAITITAKITVIQVD